MAKRKYNPNLTATERHRVSDALYRMKKEGFEGVENFDVSKITNAKTYDDIYKEVVKYNPDLTFRPKDTQGNAINTILPGAVGYEATKAKKEYNKALSRARFTGEKVAALKFNIASYNPKGFWNQKSNQTLYNKIFAKEINKLYARLPEAEKRKITTDVRAYQDLQKKAISQADAFFEKIMQEKFRHSILKMTAKIKAGPHVIYMDRVRIARDNLVTSLKKHMTNTQLRQAISNALNSLSLDEFDTWLAKYEKDIQEEIYGYDAEMINNIEKWLPALFELAGYPNINGYQYDSASLDLLIMEIKAGNVNF